MKFKRLLFVILGIFSIQGIFAQPATTDLTTYVNPFIGTGGHGHTYPGAVLPFGMVQLSPDTRLTGWDGCSAYHYSDSIIYGFSHTHLSGTGCSDYGDILLMPTQGEVKFKNTDYSSPFSHAKEKAEPGFYAVYLDKPKVSVALTSTLRAGFHQYTFPASTQSNILIDLIHRDEVLESSLEIIGNNEVRGLRRSKAWAEDQWVYFVARFSKPFQSYVINDQGKPVTGNPKISSKSLQVALTFTTAEQESILVKVGISAVSAEGAAKNLDTEIPAWDFEACKRAAKAAWNKELHKIEVESPLEKDLVVFYSSLYHVMLAPNLYMDVDHRYRGRDNKIHTAENFDYYTVFSLWDTYRAEHPLLALIDRKRTNDFINTFLAQYEQGGLLPVWELSSNETFCMIGYHAVPVIMDAYAKKIRGYDVEKAYQACVHSANFDRAGLGAYIANGYVPGDQEHESVSKTLEYAYDDWCLALFSKRLNKRAENDYYLRRSQSYKNLLDPSTLFMRARVNGGWYKPFKPGEVNNHYTEANAWQYSLYVPQDIGWLVTQMQGKANFSARLDELFSTSEDLSGRDQADITGLIGQYAHGNEPSHHMAYLYNYIGEPWKTQEIINKIVTDFYGSGPDGLIGNEDCGQMSAWYVLSSLGIYQVCPGDNQWLIGKPHFTKATLHFEDGQQFVFTAPQVNARNRYILTTIFNNELNTRSYIPHEFIAAGGTMHFEMGPEPNRNWASSPTDVPFSNIPVSLIVPTPFINASSRSFSDTLHISLGGIEADAIYYTLDGSRPDSTKTAYSKPFIIKNNTTIKAISYKKGQGKSTVVEGNFFRIEGGRSIRLNTTYENQYSAGGPNGLIDGIKGSTNWRLGGWQGYQNNDVDAVVDLGKVKKISRVSAGFLQQTAAWIVFPSTVEILVSEDGKEFRSLGILSTGIDIKDMEIRTHEVVMNCKEKARYVKVKARNYGKLPEWHESPGGDAHLFIDEITIE